MQELAPQELQDAPEHFGRFYPCRVNLQTGKVDQASEWGNNWYWEEMTQMLKRPRVHFGYSFDPVVGPQAGDLIVNALDPIFGHALYKVAAANAVVREARGRRTWCLVTKNVRRYLADEAGCISYNGSAMDLRQIDISAAELLVNLDSRGVSWAFAQCSRMGEQRHFLSDQVFRTLRGRKRSTILFVMRDDRPWGGLTAIQDWRVRSLCWRLRGSIGCDIVGAGYGSARWLDSVDRKINLSENPGNADRTLLEEAAESVLCFGVHGSHLLLPSSVSWGIVELIPSSRIGNFGQAIWPDPERSVVDVIYGFRPIMGRDRWLLKTGVTEVATAIEACYAGYRAWSLRQDGHTIYGSR